MLRILALSALLATPGPSTAASRLEPPPTLALSRDGDQIMTWGRRRADAVSDDTGGFYAVWCDGAGLKLQRIGADGQVASGWPEGGLVVASGTDRCEYLIGDGAGGVVVSWVEAPPAYWPSKLKVLRIGPDARPTPGWAPAGLVLAAPIGECRCPALTAVEKGAFLLAWRQQNLDGSQSVRLERVLLSGALAVGWPAGGLVVDGELDLGDFPEAVADGSGGALVAWVRSGEISRVLMLQRVTAGARTAPGWPARGFAVAGEGSPAYFWPTRSEDEDRPLLASDGRGGAFLTWNTLGSGPDVALDLYLQRVAGDGRIARGWPRGGLPIGVAPGSQYFSDLVSDGAGGVYVSWFDEGLEHRSWVVRRDARGAPAPGWEAGRSIPSPRGVVLAPDAAGVFVSWLDETWTEATGSRFHPRVLRLPAEPIMAGQESAPIGDGQGDVVRWSIVADGAGGAFALWQESRPGLHHCVVVAQHPVLAPHVPLAGNAPRPPVFALLPPRPNPAVGAVAIEFEIPVAAAVEVTVFDIAGRVVRTLARAQPLPPGPHRIAWSLDGRDHRRVAAGVYLVRLKAGAEMATEKLVVTP